MNWFLYDSDLIRHERVQGYTTYIFAILFFKGTLKAFDNFKNRQRKMCDVMFFDM